MTSDNAMVVSFGARRAPKQKVDYGRIMDYDKITQAVASGMSFRKISQSYGMSDSIFYKLKETNADLKAAIAKGKELLNKRMRQEAGSAIDAKFEVEAAAVEIDIGKVYQLASDFLSENQIARCLGLAPWQFKKVMDRDPRIVEAIERARAEIAAEFGGALKREALENGNARLIEFYLRSKQGWTERHELTIRAPDGVEEMTDEELKRLAAGETEIVDAQIIEDTDAQKA